MACTADATADCRAVLRVHSRDPPMEDPRSLVQPKAHAAVITLLTGRSFLAGWLPHGAGGAAFAVVAERCLGLGRGAFSVLIEVPEYFVEAYATRAVLRVRGGKGGFGSTLKQTGKNASQRTVNFDACRNLQGRRVRQERQVRAMMKWADGEDNADEKTLMEVGGVLTASDLKKRDRANKKLLEEPRSGQRETRKEKEENREKRIVEGFLKESDVAEIVGESTQDAVASSLAFKKKSKRSEGDVACPVGHALESMDIGRGDEKTGFDYNICDECDEEIVQTAFRCSECDYDVCCTCRNRKATRSQSDEAKKADKNKKKKKGFGHDFGDSSDDE
ncbi:hypothetical protein DIPPA_16378 [Diplonema papillatum]|nr:hypothetical protein DIPPA_16378 [Diplonema papillatum]KAJ9468668.1 hypothetical protein DIPPA_16378 [Diplonema papillatum]